MDALISDIRFAIRSLAKAKLFTIVALASLALGIGANVTVFSLVNAIALKPLPFAEPDQLVDLHEWSATKLCSGCSVGTSTGDIRRLARQHAVVRRDGRVSRAAVRCFRHRDRGAHRRRGRIGHAVRPARRSRGARAARFKLTTIASVRRLSCCSATPCGRAATARTAASSDRRFA